MRIALFRYDLKVVLFPFSLQFAASSQQDAREWVDHINFVLKGKPSSLYFYFYTCFFFLCDVLFPSCFLDNFFSGIKAPQHRENVIIIITIE